MLENFFKPESIAVIGASKSPHKVGHTVLKNILQYGYKGNVYPINLKEKEILGKKVYANVKDIPDPVDLAIIIIPPKHVTQAIADCGEKGIDSVIIITAGFRETGGKGAQLEKELLAEAEKHGTRIMGPNCLGLINTHHNLNASFANSMPRRGNISFISQSGALCAAVLDWVEDENVGFSKFVSFGNKLDIKEADLINTLAEDDESEVILAYLEDIASGLQFLQASEKITKRKPLIILKAGRTPAGSKAISSHTGSLAGDDNAYTMAFKQTEAIRAQTTEELFDFAKCFASQPLPKGPNIAVITNAGGPGVMAADAVEYYKMKLAKLDKKSSQKLEEFLPSAASISNPVDVLGDARADRYGEAAKVIFEDPNVDTIILILTPQAMTQIKETAEIVGEISQDYDKPIIACFMGKHEVDKVKSTLGKYKIPNLYYPERCIKTLKVMYQYYLGKNAQMIDWVSERKSHLSDRQDKVAKIFAKVIEDEHNTLTETEASLIFQEYDIPIMPQILLKEPSPIQNLPWLNESNTVLKIVSQDILHKSDIGGVKLDLRNPEQIEKAYHEILANAKKHAPEAEIKGVLASPMLSSGQDVILGMKQNLQFGPMLIFGLGGIYVEILKDVSFRLAPINKEGALQMIKEIKSYQTLTGIRGQKPSDINAIAEALVNLSALCVDFPIIQELDINPFRALEKGKGGVALDAKMIIDPSKKHKTTKHID